MEIDESKLFSLIIPVFREWDRRRLKTLGKDHDRHRKVDRERKKTSSEKGKTLWWWMLPFGMIHRRETKMVAEPRSQIPRF
jgi:hypothetical protein